MEFDFSWNYLITAAGCGSLVLIIVQLTKEYIKMPVRLYVALVSFLVLGVAAFCGGFVTAWQDIPLIIFNAFPIAMTAMGEYAALEKKINNDVLAETITEPEPDLETEVEVKAEEPPTNEQTK